MKILAIATITVLSVTAAATANAQSSPGGFVAHCAGMLNGIALVTKDKGTSAAAAGYVGMMKRWIQEGKLSEGAANNAMTLGRSKAKVPMNDIDLDQARSCLVQAKALGFY